MSLRNYITEKIILPLSDKFTKQSISSFLDFLMESQKWSKSDIEDYQNELLRKLILHAYNNVEYYHNLFRKLKLTPNDIKCKKDLQKLPILTKEVIRENIANGKLIASNINKRELLLNSSSGSTGEPLQFYVTAKSYSMNIAANLRGWYNMGYRLGDKYIKLSVNPRTSKIKRMQDFVNNCIYFSSKGINVEDIEQFVSLINKKRPKFLRGYPSSLSVIADYIIENDIHVNGIKAINTTGEILFPKMKTIIEKAFRAKVFDSYSGEGGATMFQDHNGIYNVAHEYAITELLDNNDNIIEKGVGEIITTDLWNYANPFIRYAIKDSVEVFNETDNSKPFRVKRILGRNVDMLKTPNGKILIVHFFTGYFEWIPSVKQFQIRQDSEEEFVLNLAVNKSFTKEIELKIVNDIKEYMGHDVKLKVNIVSYIPPQPNGKTRFMFKNF